MGRASSAAVILAIVSFVVAADALPRIQSLSAIVDADMNAVDLIAVEDIVVPDTVEYKNPKPLIGILSQACHYCPGK